MGFGSIKVFQKFLKQSSHFSYISGRKSTTTQLNYSSQYSSHGTSLTGLNKVLESDSHMLGNLSEGSCSAGELINNWESTLNSSDGWVKFVLDQGLEFSSFSVSCDFQLLQVSLDLSLVGYHLSQVSLCFMV